ncbi:AMP-binding enzyme, putative [Cordyceps militaris CM01]|uniref:AMP-binding enzyme, putative n=1 Tax=Cordyceps militaris (strain CM01) TaxID=983644 RepID=G3JJM5_CORMM|nr:AMP-binding enzyme, putative [Cordyceps militaris CM01]EGX91265.1 AMP-binding enzyme, putative [Cordyceps militaris CM01]
MDYTTRLFSHGPDDASADRPALVDADCPARHISRRQYKSAVKRIAVGLANLGVADQDGVGLLSDNDIYYYVLGDGAVAAGAVYAGIPTFVKQAELATAIQTAGIKWLFAAPAFLELALATVHDLGLPSSMVLVFDPPGLEPYTGAQASLSKLMHGADEASFRNANEGKDPATREAFRFFTSGSTGSVKAAIISHQASVVRANLVSSMPGMDKPFLLMIGMFHISGILLHMGACVGGYSGYICKGDDATTVIDKIHSLGIGATMITPRLMETMTALPDSAELRRRLASLQQVSFAGAPCRQETVTSIRRMLPDNAKLMTGYGATELPGICSIVIDDNWVTGCVGRVASCTTVRIVDPDTLQEAPPGAAGEVCARSPASFSGYYNNAEATVKAFLPGEPGWVRTGDKGIVDPDTGLLTLLGRFKEIFKVRYEEVSPTEVESVLLQNGDVTDALVTSTQARDDDKDRECLAYVVRRADAQLTAQQVVDFVASKLAAHKAPTGGVLFCDKIPRGTMGKPLKSELDNVVPLPDSARFLTLPAQ